MTTEFLWYAIRVGGQLGDRRPAWFDGLGLTRRVDASTALAGPVADQAALYGFLERMRDLGLGTLSLNCVGPGRCGAACSGDYGWKSCVYQWLI